MAHGLSLPCYISSMYVFVLPNSNNKHWTFCCRVYFATVQLGDWNFKPADASLDNHKGLETFSCAFMFVTLYVLHSQYYVYCVALGVCTEKQPKLSAKAWTKQENDVIFRFFEDELEGRMVLNVRRFQAYHTMYPDFMEKWNRNDCGLKFHLIRERKQRQLRREQLWCHFLLYHVNSRGKKKCTLYYLDW